MDGRAGSPAAPANMAADQGPLRRLWGFLRELSGDDAYERYLAHQTREHPDATPMDRRGHFEHSQRQKWSGVNRCC